jgi:glycerophosphoryl diester phosphodiesterase
VTLARTRHWPYPRWVAHRGAGTLAPENTLAAFRKGAEHGYRMFECDAKLSADDVVFLMHDASLHRTTNGEGMGGEHAWQHLSQLDAGSWHSRHFSGEPLPTLANVAQFCIRNRYCLNIEIKPTPGVEFKTGEVVAREAALLWQHEAVPPLLTSFQVAALQAAFKAAPQLPRGLLLNSLSEGWLENAKSLACSAVVCLYALWTPDTVKAVHDAGMKCLSYTVNDEWAAQHLLALGTDGIITDRVDLFSPAA